MAYLRQSTASQSRAIGPFLDDTDFKTAETGLTIANTDIKLVVNGGASANKNSGGGTHRVNGVYGVTFDATDTATVGEMEVSVVVSGALPVFHKFTVLEEAVYDELFAASALGYVANAPVNVAQFGGSNGTFSSGIPAVNAAQISGDSTAADNLEAAFDDSAGAVPWTGILDQGTAQSVTGTTIVLRAGASFDDDTIIGCTVFAKGSTQGYWHSPQEITDYVASTKTATLSPGFATTPSGTVIYQVQAGPPALSTPPDVNVVRISGDSTAADNAESFFDGTGYAGTNNVIPTVTTVTNTANANVVQISGDSTAADNAESFFDGTGYNGANNVIPLVTTVTTLTNDPSGVTTLLSRVGTPSNLGGAGANVGANLNYISQTQIANLPSLRIAASTIGATGNDTTHVHLPGLGYGDDELNDYLLVIRDVSAGEYHSVWIEDFVGSSALATVATLPFTPEASTDTYQLFAVRRDSNVKKINSTTVLGVGTSGNKWRGS